MNHNYYIGRELKNGVKEGGVARDFALYSYLKDKSIHIKITERKIITILRVFYLFIFSRNNSIILHYPFSGLSLTDKYVITKVFRKLLMILLRYASYRNSLIIDIADLPIEQAIDLQLPVEHYYKELELTVFSLRAHYIFSSSSMRDYVVKKYTIDPIETTVCINGGNTLLKSSEFKYEDIINSFDIVYVYAGTLNKGRQIEELISLFPKLKYIKLVLIGEGGEWIKDFTKQQNIHYLGALEESEAHELVSKCDVGLIPYASDRLYYNLAFPTKLSFYITAGITFLSTDVQEVKNINEDYHFGIIENFQNWHNIFKVLTRDDIEFLKLKVREHRSEFYWQNTFDKKIFRRLLK